MAYSREEILRLIKKFRKAIEEIIHFRRILSSVFSVNSVANY